MDRPLKHHELLKVKEKHVGP